MSFIQVDNLQKSYDMGNRKILALRGVSLNIEEGERVFLGGPSGSGKSTLLHIIGCLDHFDGGMVTIGEKNITKADDSEMSHFRACNIGFVFQNFNLLPVLNVTENVEYPLILNGMKNLKQRRGQVMAMLKAVGLDTHAKHFPNELSGGQRQRVAIARALVHKPRLLIADEPTANLDSVTGSAIMELMLGLSRSHGSTVIICTHNPVLLGRAERLIMLLDGLVEKTDLTNFKPINQ